jgi:benzoyl-CoA reductase/2-hydroxyglutaryl-CoA dehydratase subunit BcrC/BadD/HgdB
MNVAKTYGDAVRRRIPKKPETAGAMIRTGLHLESFRCAHFADRKMPKAYRFLNSKAVGVVGDALDRPEHCAWTNIFAPTELLQTFGLTCVSMECLASYLSGFWLEDYFIDRAEDAGIASTLCSYHKNFLGAVETGVVSKPVLGVTTSMICDGNINTFRYLRQRFGVEDFVLDIPHEWSPEAERYVVEQLRELICLLERKTGRKYDEDALREMIRRENESKEHFRSALRKRVDHDYPNTMTLVLFLLLATHLNIGSQWVLDFFRMMDREIEGYPPAKGKRLMWIHLTPYSQPTLQSYLNYNDDYAIVCDDFNCDYLERMDEEHPLEALARKMLRNIYNGPFERKAEVCAAVAKELRCDAVVEFCHWGCKQSAGGALLLKQKMREAGVPMLILDGDALDRRNNHDGQIRTRFEAFLEVLNRGEEAAG